MVIGVFLVLTPRRSGTSIPGQPRSLICAARVPLEIIAGIALADFGRPASNLGDKASIFLGIIQLATGRYGYKRPA